MDDLERALKNVSLSIANFGDGEVCGFALQDWFEFLGGKPGQVTFVDMGSDAETQGALRELERKGWIDVLCLREPNANVRALKETAYIHEYTAYALASKPYILMAHLDTLPFRRGHADWLPQALEFLERPDVFAVSGSYNFFCKRGDAHDGWFPSDKCSQNFALMKRERFFAATEEYMGEFIRSGFRGQNPAQATGQERYVIELAFERYMLQHGLQTLMRIEDPTWSVLHTNIRGKGWQQTRAAYRARKKIAPFLNAGANPKLVHPRDALYYGQPRPGLVKRARIRFGQSRVGPLWRDLKRKLALF